MTTKVFANSIPKGGTHLLLKLLVLLGFREDPFWIGADLIYGGFSSIRRRLRKGRHSDLITIGCETPVQIGQKWLRKRLRKVKPGSVFGGHCIYTQELGDLLQEENVKIVSILRDPRSVAVSHMYHIKKDKKHFFHNEYMALLDDDATLLLSIKGGNMGPYRLQSLYDRYVQFYRWNEHRSAVMIRFEDLVGPEGGGRFEVQRKAIKRVVKHIQLEIDDNDVERVQKKIFGGTNTFRKGQIDGWRSEMSKEHVLAIEEVMGNFMRELGYPQ